MNRFEIPIELCRICRHYNGHMCVLQDLSPCEFVLDEKKANMERVNERAKSILLASVVIFALIMSILAVVVSCTARREEPKPEYHWSAVELLKEYHGQDDTLTEFQMLTMAIALTESRFRPDAVGTAGDSGVLQLRDVYVREVNRLCRTDYTIEDAFDIGKSIEIFNKMQEAKNPSYNLDTAIRLHNKSDAYRQTVLRNLDEIKRYEKVREELTK